MIRQAIEAKGVGYEKDFRWRGGQVSRIEGFSDAVLAFAVTLLVVSLEVPRTFDDLMRTMKGFIAFGICFTFLIWIWYNHYIYFRRYGLQNSITVTLNAILLFVILFYIYPLKFLFTILINYWFGYGFEVEVFSASGQMQDLMRIYSLGFLAIFTLFLFLYFHAWRRRDELELNALEKLHTRIGMHAQIINMSVALVSIGFSMINFNWSSAVAGLTYCLVGPAHGIYWAFMSKRVEKLRLEVGL